MNKQRNGERERAGAAHSAASVGVRHGGAQIAISAGWGDARSDVREIVRRRFVRRAKILERIVERDEVARESPIGARICFVEHQVEQIEARQQGRRKLKVRDDATVRVPARLDGIGRREN